MLNLIAGAPIKSVSSLHCPCESAFIFNSHGDAITVSEKVLKEARKWAEENKAILQETWDWGN